MFTHHQKTVILDAPFPAGAKIPVVNGRSPTKRVIAYVGGLDLTNGRYDFHHHPLFETCCEEGPHCEDKYQGCIEGKWEGWDAEGSSPCNTAELYLCQAAMHPV